MRKWGEAGRGGEKESYKGGRGEEGFRIPFAEQYQQTSQNSQNLTKLTLAV
jgi:hypothetical protein